MIIQNNQRSFVRLIVDILLIMIPTIFIAFMVIKKVNIYLSFLNMKPLLQIGFFAAGFFLSYLIYFFRVRFLLSFICVLIALYIGYHSIEKFYPGEFDSFFISVQFIQYAAIFLIAWITAYGLVRFRYFVIAFSCFLLTINIIIISKNTEIKAEDIFWFFFPILFYTVYIIYVRELIPTVFKAEKNRILILARRLSIFILFLLFAFWAGYYFLFTNYEAILSRVGATGASQGKSDGNLIKENDDNTFDLEKFAELRSRLDRPNEKLLFAAYLDNFFEGNPPEPNPLYFTCYYLTKYDSKKERFEIDPFMPFSDQFNPDPSKIPLFFTQTDSMVIPNSKSTKYRRVTNVDVYVSLLSPKTFTAPSTAFACQPFTIEDDFKDQFKSAYRAKCYISDLNSAYFVYNIDHPIIKQFAEIRQKILSNAKNYKKVDSTFLNYYTYMPKGTVFDSIRTLANEITQGATLPIDKVLKIRDFFLSKDSAGKPVFKYTLLPGASDTKENQGLQNISNLSYFLFKNKKGYCTYFAGSTLFLLRACGIPSRMAVGFLTENRSNKNPGWYWFYSDQAHAWVQVYFPGYGWLDFDTTIGDSNNEARESQKPDGTPPSQPPKAIFAGKGILVIQKDTTLKQITFALKEMVFKDQEFKSIIGDTLILDLSKAKIKYAETETPWHFDSLRVGDNLLTIAYNPQLEKTPLMKSSKQILAQFPKVILIDEVHILPKDEFKKEEQKRQKKKDEKRKNLENTLLIILLIIGSIAIILFSWPSLCYLYLASRVKRAKNGKRKAYWIYRYVGFLLNQVGFVREGETPLEYAKNSIDPILSIRFESFIQLYLKTKYAPVELTQEEMQSMDYFYNQLNESIRTYFKKGKLITQFLNIRLTYNFFIKPKE